jgi:ABC-type nitrate/sulfonate/bicarbonate transport system ATPase subunit
MTFSEITIDGLHVHAVRHKDGERTTLIARAGLRIGAGEVVVVLGRSGAGKSTLLRAIAGVQHYEQSSKSKWIIEGSFKLDGAAWSEAERADGKNIGLAGQDGYLYPFLSVVDNVRYGGHETGSAITELKRVGLEEHRHHVLPDELSGGETHRVCIAKAVGRSPKLLLVDESLSQQDPLTKLNLVNDCIVPWTKQSRAAVIVSHDISLARFANQVVVVSRLESRMGVSNVAVVGSSDWKNPLFDHDDEEVRKFHRIYHEPLS